MSQTFYFESQKLSISIFCVTLLIHDQADKFWIKKTINWRKLQYIYQHILTGFITRNVWCSVTRIDSLILWQWQFNQIPPKTKCKQSALWWFKNYLQCGPQIWGGIFLRLFVSASGRLGCLGGDGRLRNN